MIAALGLLDGKTHRLPVRVYFEDTDLAGVVYYANYLRFMERGRSDFLTLVGIDQRARHEAGEGVYVVRDVAIRYLAPGRLGDDLTVESRLTAVSAATATIHQRVRSGDRLLTDGNVVAAWLTVDGRPQRQPREWVERFKELIDA